MGLYPWILARKTGKVKGKAHDVKKSLKSALFFASDE
jgi:hypothetical protein